MEVDRTSGLREKIARLGTELDCLQRAIKEEIDLHERWSGKPPVQQPDEENQQ